MRKIWLYNKTVLITGASGGIGFSVAKLLIEKYNCHIIGIARNEQKMLNAIESLGDKKANFTYRLFDVSKKENWLDFYEYTVKNQIKIDVLFNNAGFMLPFAKYEDYSDEEIDEIVKTNFLANLWCIKTLLPIIKTSQSPAIFNVSSAAGLCAVVGQSMYCATKFAMRGFTETLYQEYKKEIFVGGIYPGFIKTDILNRQSESAKNNKLINKLMMPVEKASKKIVKGMARKKPKIVMGIDGKPMSFFGRIFPKLTPSLITAVLKSSHLEMFDGVFKNQKGTDK